MTRFFKSWTFILLLCVALILTIVPSVLSLMGQGTVVRNAIGVMLSPARNFFSWIGEGFAGFVEYFTEFDRVKEENAELRAQLEGLGDELYAAQVKSEENEWLRSFLGLKRENTDFSFCEARIIGRESGSYMTVFTLDCGSANGIEINMPVVTARGIVGSVTEVGLNWCKATTILEYTSSVGVYCERSGALGLCEGTYELRERSLCRISYLDENADVRIGDRFVTSGLGSVFPMGLAVGEVRALYPDSYGRGLIAEIAPLADFTDLSRVMVITGFQNDAENLTDGTASDSSEAKHSETEAAE